MDNRPLSITITTGTILKVVLILLGAFLLYWLFDLALIVLTSVVLASALEPIIKWCGRYGLPRTPSVIIFYVLIAAALFTMVFFFAPPMLGEVTKLSVELPRILETFQLADLVPEFSGESDTVIYTDEITGIFSLKQMLADVQATLIGFTQGFFQTASIIFGGAFSFILTVVLSFYFAVQERGIEKFLRVVVPLRHEEYVLDLWHRSQVKIGLWLQGQMLLGILIAVLTFLGLTILQVDYALVLALIAGVLELIPIFGPIIAAVPAVIFGFTQSTTVGFMVLGLYIIIQQFENHLIYPLVVTKIVGVPPLLVIIALIAGAQIAGFLGILLAVPMAAVLAELFDDLGKRKNAPPPAYSGDA